MSVSQKKVRLWSVEILRIISAILIICYHEGFYYSDVTYSGLITFIALSFYFEFGSNIHKSTKISSLASRLLLPWAVWWFVFALINIIRHRPPLKLDQGLLGAILAGPSVHLWYIPFAFMTLFAASFIKKLYPTKVLAFGAAIVAIGLFMTVPVWRPVTLSWGAPWAQYGHALAPAVFGALLGLARSGRFEQACLAAATLALLASAGFAIADVSLPYVLGIAAVAVAVFVGTRVLPMDWDLTRWSGAMLGVYLVHPLVLSLVHPITRDFKLMSVALAFIISFCFVLLVQRLAPRISKFVVG